MTSAPLRWRPHHEFSPTPHQLDLWWCPQAAPQPPRDRRRRVDALLRQVLARYLGCAPEALRFAREAHGRPYLAGAPAPDFNLSDTRGGSLIAVTARGRVGVDLERGDRQLPVSRLAERWFAGSDSAWLAQQDAEAARQQFLYWWTAKEAACKATGTGIFGWLPRWRFSRESEGSALQAEEIPGAADPAAAWSFHRLRPTPDHLAVVCGTDLPGDRDWRGFILTPD